MKKFLSILLALALVLSLGTVAFAVEGDWDGEYAPTSPTTFSKIVKDYTSDGPEVVNETLTFTSEVGEDNPTNANVTVDPLEITSLEGNILKVNIPALSEAGVYEWIITEDEGNTAGVTYSTDEIHIIALVVYNNDSHALEIAEIGCSVVTPGTENKKDTFLNTFSSGSFTVAKDVDGNMANENDEFDITVTLTSDKKIGTTIMVGGAEVAADQWTEANGEWTLTKELQLSEKDGPVTFARIPAGVTVTVKEEGLNEKNEVNGYTYTSTKGGTQTVTNNEFTMQIADDTAAEVVVTNVQNTSVETGITLDSLPYVLLLVGACAGLVVFFARRRMTHKG